MKMSKSYSVTACVAITWSLLTLAVGSASTHRTDSRHKKDVTGTKSPHANTGFSEKDIHKLNKNARAALRKIRAQRSGGKKSVKADKPKEDKNSKSDTYKPLHKSHMRNDPGYKHIMAGAKAAVKARRAKRQRMKSRDKLVRHTPRERTSKIVMLSKNTKQNRKICKDALALLNKRAKVADTSRYSTRANFTNKGARRKREENAEAEKKAAAERGFKPVPWEPRLKVRWLKLMDVARSWAILKSEFREEESGRPEVKKLMRARMRLDISYKDLVEESKNPEKRLRLAKKVLKDLSGFEDSAEAWASHPVLLKEAEKHGHGVLL